MKILLASVAYAALAIFYIGASIRFIVYLSGGGPATPAGTRRIPNLLLAMLDIFLLRRLFKANPGVWPGAWVFHISFILVFLGHLRFFFYDVPAWMVDLANISPYAGLALLASLAYIFIYRLAVERGQYSSAYNLLLVSGIFFLSFTGFLLARLFRPDIFAAKNFMMGFFSLHIVEPPQNWLFPLHFLLAFTILMFLPTHIFTAPFITIEARRRRTETERLLHD